MAPERIGGVFAFGRPFAAIMMTTNLTPRSSKVISSLIDSFIAFLLICLDKANKSASLGEDVLSHIIALALGVCGIESKVYPSLG